MIICSSCLHVQVIVPQQLQGHDIGISSNAYSLTKTIGRPIIKAMMNCKQYMHSNKLL